METTTGHPSSSVPPQGPTDRGERSGWLGCLLVAAIFLGLSTVVACWLAPRMHSMGSSWTYSIIAGSFAVVCGAWLILAIAFWAARRIKGKDQATVRHEARGADLIEKATPPAGPRGSR